eukprot:1663461-Ditylum_brightwellii.AAC.1
MNVEMDNLVKVRVDVDTSLSRPPLEGALEGDRWTLHLVSPKSPSLVIDVWAGRKINTNLESQLKEHVFGSPLQKYWEDHS